MSEKKPNQASPSVVHPMATLPRWALVLVPLLMLGSGSAVSASQSGNHNDTTRKEAELDRSTEVNDVQWELKKDKKGVQVYTRTVAGSKFKAVRATMMVQSGLAELTALVRDPDACADWADLCAEAREHERISETELYVYTLNNVPWPVSDRDALAHVLWTQDPETLAVTMTATATDNILPEVKGAVRLTNAVTQWIFTPTANGEVSVVTEAHVDPAGPTPAWLTNLLLVDSPFKTMTNLRKLVSTGRYKDAQFEFITEPRLVDSNIE